MVWFVIALVAVVVCGFVVRRGLRARERRRRLGEETAAVRALLSEDLTWLREDLGRLDREVAGLMLDEASRDDRDVAHESFEAAERGLPGSRTVADVGKVAAALADATYRMPGAGCR